MASSNTFKFAQEEVFTITRGAILEGVKLINRKLNVVLSAPLKLAEDYLGKFWVHMESQSYGDAIKELEKVRDQALEAFRCAEGQGATQENLKSAIAAKRLSIFSEILTKSYNGTMIVPFPLLSSEKKKIISRLIEEEIKSMKRFRNSYKVSMFTWDKATEEKKVQDLLDELLQKSYPFISQGRGFTDPLNTVTHLSFKILPDFIPEGEEGSALVSLGQHEGKDINVRVWKEQKHVVVRLNTGESRFWGEEASFETGQEMEAPTGHLTFSMVEFLSLSKFKFGQH